MNWTSARQSAPRKRYFPWASWLYSHRRSSSGAAVPRLVDSRRRCGSLPLESASRSCRSWSLAGTAPEARIIYRPGKQVNTIHKEVYVILRYYCVLTSGLLVHLRVGKLLPELHGELKVLRCAAYPVLSKAGVWRPVKWAIYLDGIKKLAVILQFVYLSRRVEITFSGAFTFRVGPAGSANEYTGFRNHDYSPEIIIRKDQNLCIKTLLAREHMFYYLVIWHISSSSNSSRAI